MKEGRFEQILPMLSLMRKWSGKLQRVRVFADGAIRPGRGASGLAAIVRDERGDIRCWWAERAGPLTNNSAEFAAVLMALERLSQEIKPTHVDVYSDSRLVVDLALGRATARAVLLRDAQARLRVLVTRFASVRFHHIPRERNRLADALANDVVDNG